MSKVLIPEKEQKTPALIFKFIPKKKAAPQNGTAFKKENIVKMNYLGSWFKPPLFLTSGFLSPVVAPPFVPERGETSVGLP